jgi:hypothetical protein
LGANNFCYYEEVIGGKTGVGLNRIAATKSEIPFDLRPGGLRGGGTTGKGKSTTALSHPTASPPVRGHWACLAPFVPGGEAWASNGEQHTLHLQIFLSIPDFSCSVLNFNSTPTYVDSAIDPCDFFFDIQYIFSEANLLSGESGLVSSYLLSSRVIYLRQYLE